MSALIIWVSCLLNVGIHPAEVVVARICEVGSVVSAVVRNCVPLHLVVLIRRVVAVERELYRVHYCLVAAVRDPEAGHALRLESVRCRGVNRQRSRYYVDLVEVESLHHTRNVVADLVMHSHCEILSWIIITVSEVPCIDWCSLKL